VELWLIVFAVCALWEIELVVGAEVCGFVFASGMSLGCVGGVRCLQLEHALG
jgi:hypothetical protein